MFKWLIFLGVTLYAALLIGGEDDGQLRAGLREQPDPQSVLIEPVPDTAQTVAQTTPAAMAATLPQQPIRILPAPTPIPATAQAAPQSVDQPTASATTDPEFVEAEALPPNTELRWVSVERANVRNGPSRNASVTGRVEGGEAVLVLWVEESGWARIRVEGDGVDGFVHSSLLSAADPQAE